MKKIISICILILTLFAVSCTSGHSFTHQVNTIVKPYRFSIAGWEFKTYFERTKQLFNKSEKNTQDDEQVTGEYVTLSNRIRELKTQINAENEAELQLEINELQKKQDNLTSALEKIIKNQTRQVLTELGIYQPWYRNVKLKFNFPPPDFELQAMPHQLVISSRNTIETIKDIFLVADLSIEEIVTIENEVDKLNVSSLVVDLGGVSTYPNLVASDSNFTYILETCAHEWAHAYLFFTPLGFRQMLNTTGLARNHDVDTINETSADIIGKEISAAVIKKFYPQFQTTETSSQTVVNESAFDFNQEMRNIRKTVDQYLAAGEVDTAEKFMQEKRDYLATNGYYIRKLNQAYFAFYGQYADVPAFENPIGTKLSQLRATSDSLKDFIVTVSMMTSLRDLEAALK
jgi:hypothetical protein